MNCPQCNADDWKEAGYPFFKTVMRCGNCGALYRQYTKRWVRSGNTYAQTFKPKPERPKLLRRRNRAAA